MQGIYIIKNNVNNKLYLGKSVDVKKRIRQHFNALKSGYHDNDYLQKSYDKYGESSFSSEIIDVDDSLSHSELCKLEIMYIRLFNLKNSEFGYNLTYGGGGSLGYKATSLQKLKRSIRVRGENNPFYGKKVSHTHRLKLTEATRNFPRTKEYRDKLSKAMKGRVFSEEHSKNKSLAQLGGANPGARRVMVHGEKFECVKDAAIKYNIPQNTASWRFKSESERFKEWKYLD